MQAGQHCFVPQHAGAVQTRQREMQKIVGWQLAALERCPVLARSWQCYTQAIQGRNQIKGIDATQSTLQALQVLEMLAAAHLVAVTEQKAVENGKFGREVRAC